MIVVTLVYFGSSNKDEVAKKSDEIHHDPDLGVKLLSHYVFQEQEAFPSARTNRLVGISIAEVVNNSALNTAKAKLEAAGAEVHTAMALQIAPGGAVGFNQLIKTPPGVTP